MSGHGGPRVFSPSAASSSAVPPGSASSPFRAPSSRTIQKPPRFDPSPEPSPAKKDALAKWRAKRAVQVPVVRPSNKRKFEDAPSPSPRKRSSSELPPSSGDILQDFMQYTPTTLVISVWGDAAYQDWRDRNKREKTASKKAREDAVASNTPQPAPVYSYPSARDILELTGPQQQCVRTIEPPGMKPCYLCGVAFGPLEVKNGLSAECEHVLSVAQAVLFYKLYQTIDADTGRGYFEREYRWAHELCNREKSDDNIITYSSVTKQFSVDTTALRAVIHRIGVSTRAGSELLKPNFKGDWENSRVVAVSKDIAPMVAYLNTQLSSGGAGMLGLVAAANVLERSHSAFNKIDPTAARTRIIDEVAVDVEAIEPDVADAVAEEELEGLDRPMDLGLLEAAAAQVKDGGKRRKTYRMRRCRLPKLL